MEDAALIGRRLQGIDPDDETTRRVPAADWLGGLKAGLAGLRLGLAETVFFDQADPEVETAVRESKAILGATGAAVESGTCPKPPKSSRIPIPPSSPRRKPVWSTTIIWKSISTDWIR